MTAVSILAERQPLSGEPQWIRPKLQVKPGRDPLGLQTITIDRILPRLVPGILALSRRARYFSFHPFLLDEYHRQRLAASNQALSEFVKAREYEYALAVQLCPQGCGVLPTGVVGKERAAPAVRRASDLLPRGESVESYLGGYGLYYRTPLIDVGLVAPAGTPLGEGTTPVDVLADQRAEGLAEAFRQAVARTDYYLHHMRGVEPIPTTVLEEYASYACLCRLSDFPAEQQLLRGALFEPSSSQPAGDVVLRRGSFAFFLSLVDSAPEVTESDAAFRQAIWQAIEHEGDERGQRTAIAARWAALVAKDYLQEALASVWAATCRLGNAHQPPEGFTTNALDMLLRRELPGSSPLATPDGEVSFDAAIATTVFAEAVDSATRRRSLEELRAWMARTDTATAGLAFLLVLYQRLPAPQALPSGWLEIGTQRSEHQPGLLGFGRQLTDHLATGPSVADTMVWLARRFVLAPHESIAYSKLPDFTFRFRWEHGRLRFFSKLDQGRFGLTDVRRDSMARLSHDLGLLDAVDHEARLTETGRRFIGAVLT
jgi:hypothetical protein